MIIEWLRKKHKSPLEQWIEVVVVVLPLVFLIRTFVFGLYVVPSGSMETTMLVGERFYADKFTPWFTSIKRGEIISLNDPTYKYSNSRLKNLFQRYVWGPSNWTKRVIGIPGDHVKGVIEDGHPVIYLNEKKLEEPYVNKYPLIYAWLGHIPTFQDLRTGRFNWDIRSFDPSKPYDKQPFYLMDDRLVISDKSEIYPDVPYSEKFAAYLDYPNTPMLDGSDEFDHQLGPDEFWVMGDNRKCSRDSRSWGKLDQRKVAIHGRIKFRFFSIQYTKPWSWQPIPGISWLKFDESWVILDLILHPIDFWKRIRWNRCFGKIN